MSQKTLLHSSDDMDWDEYGEGHQGPFEQGFIGNRLYGTDVREFIHAHYGSLVEFLQDDT